MVDGYAPLIFLLRDPESNVIRAASVPDSAFMEEDGFPHALSCRGEKFDRRPNTITFWDHLSRDGRTDSPTLGIRLYLMRPNDDVLLHAPFCTAEPGNVSVAHDLVYDIRLADSDVELNSDSAQAFGSLYYSAASDTILALAGWGDVHYSFPIDSRALTPLTA